MAFDFGGGINIPPALLSGLVFIIVCFVFGMFVNYCLRA